MEGIKNNMFTKDHVEAVYEARLEICKECPHFDPEGKSEKAFVPGAQSCGACGCSLKLKLRSLSSECGAVDLGEEPRWHALTDEETAQAIKDQINKNL
jgi:hypothetical protein